MGLTLDELLMIQEHISRPCNHYDCPAIKLIEREIKLKTTDFVTGNKVDINGNFIEEK